MPNSTMGKVVASARSTIRAEVDDVGGIVLTGVGNADSEEWLYVPLTPETAAAIIDVLGSVMKAAKERWTE